MKMTYGSLNDVTIHGWLPIETAPHDGTIIELLGENGKLDIGKWYVFNDYFNKSANGISEAETGEFTTEYGEGPHTHWRDVGD